MAIGRGNKLTGSIGEFLVATEICRRDLIANATHCSTNVSELKQYENQWYKVEKSTVGTRNV